MCAVSFQIRNNMSRQPPAVSRVPCAGSFSLAARWCGRFRAWRPRFKKSSIHLEGSTADFASMAYGAPAKYVRNDVLRKVRSAFPCAFDVCAHKFSTWPRLKTGIFYILKLYTKCFKVYIPPPKYTLHDYFILTKINATKGI